MTKEAVRSKIREGLEQQIFTAAQAVISVCGEIAENISCGGVSGDGSPEIDDNTLFDLASLTKVMAVTPLWMTLAEQDPKILSRPISAWYPDTPPEKAEITPAALLAHASGLPHWRPYYLLYQNCPDSDEAAARILSEPLVYKTWDGSLYSDLGFMLLRWILEKETGKGLSDLFIEQISGPLGVSEDLLFKPSAKARAIACTRNGEEPGLVHDLNARSLGGVSGHAGLFGTATAVHTVAHEILACVEGSGRLWKQPTAVEFTRRVGRPAESTRALGFDTPSEKDSSAGNLISKGAFGHTGFTGTSIWVDPSLRLVVALLTNRVIMGEANLRIKEFRPAFHDTVAMNTEGCRS
jgi:CubicO group peptidase (beta-lactamase class C family)